MAAKAMLGALWPVRNLVNFASADGSAARTSDEKGRFSGGRLRPYHDRLADYVGVFFGQLPKIAIAAACWHYTVDMEAAAAGGTWSAAFTLSCPAPGSVGGVVGCGWAARIVLRDLFLMLCVAGLWDWLLYFSPLKDRLAPYKFNAKYPPLSQLRRDVGWTLCATLLASAQEVLLMRWWGGGHFKAALFGAPHDAAELAVPHDAPFFGSSYTPYYLAWAGTMLYWRISHFFFIHRGMHPWWDRKGGLHNGDVGAFLYRHVHAHHHQSYNPTAFSGFSMTPVESIAYMSAALVPLCFRHGCHPWLHLYTKLDLIIGAQIGHDGFDAPGGGSYFHQLHHAHFECNYGDAAGIPWDWLFGCFEDGTSYDKSGRHGAAAADVPPEGGGPEGKKAR